MLEIEEIKIRSLFLNTIKNFFTENLPVSDFPKSLYDEVAHELTEELIKAYEDYRKI